METCLLRAIRPDLNDHPDFEIPGCIMDGVIAGSQKCEHYRGESVFSPSDLKIDKPKDVVEICQRAVTARTNRP